MAAHIEYFRIISVIYIRDTYSIYGLAIPYTHEKILIKPVRCTTITAAGCNNAILKQQTHLILNYNCTCNIVIFVYTCRLLWNKYFNSIFSDLTDISSP